MRAAVVIFAFMYLASPVAACQMFHITIQRQLDPEVHVFVAEVVGIVGPRTAPGIGGDFAGVRVQVVESVYPSNQAGTFDVYPFGYDTACATVGSSSESLEQRFPVGAEVFVVAWPAAEIEANGDITPLEASWQRGALGIAPVHAAELASRTIDYASAYRLEPEQFAQVYDKDRKIMVFEQQKDFARLETKSSGEKVEVLERLAGNPNVDYVYVVKKHLRWSPTRSRLIREYRRLHP